MKGYLYVALIAASGIPGTIRGVTGRQIFGWIGVHRLPVKCGGVLARASGGKLSRKSGERRCGKRSPLARRKSLGSREGPRLELVPRTLTPGGAPKMINEELHKLYVVTSIDKPNLPARLAPS